MNNRKAFVQRGDIYYANLDPVIGSEQGGIRPVLVIQNNVGNRYSPTVIVAAITSQIKHQKLPTHIQLAGEHDGLPHTSTIMLEQIRTIDRERLLSFVGNIGSQKLNEVDAALGISIGMAPNW